MRDDWEDSLALVAAGANCPVPHCGALTLAFRPKNTAVNITELWEFRCPRCGTEFITSEDKLLFHSVQEEWLRGGIHSA
jgi:hypothetical protein